jgi:hypothetical protein
MVAFRNFAKVPNIRWAKVMTATGASVFVSFLLIKAIKTGYKKNSALQPICATETKETNLNVTWTNTERTISSEKKCKFNFKSCGNIVVILW